MFSTFFTYSIVIIRSEVKSMHKFKKVFLLLLTISIASLYLLFLNSTTIEA